jgi:hypothetical protein
VQKCIQHWKYIFLPRNWSFSEGNKLMIWSPNQLSVQILNTTYLDFYTCTNISGFILRAIVRTISINVSWVLMFILYSVNAHVPFNYSKHFQGEICKNPLIPKYLWFFCNRLKNSRTQHVRQKIGIYRRGRSTLQIFTTELRWNYGLSSYNCYEWL